MPLIKRNSQEFKDVASIFEAYRKKPARKRVIMLYALKPSEPLSERVPINKLAKNAEVVYEMTYNSILDYFADKRMKLHRDSRQALYYFKRNAASDWLELPFELRGKLSQKVLPLRVVK